MKINKSLKNFIQYDYKKLNKIRDLDYLNLFLTVILNHKLNFCSDYIKPINTIQFPKDWIITYYDNPNDNKISLISTIYAPNDSKYYWHEHMSSKYFNNLASYIKNIESININYNLQYDYNSGEIIISTHSDQEYIRMIHIMTQFFKKITPHYREFNYLQPKIYSIYRKIVLNIKSNSDTLYELSHSKWIYQLCEKLRIQK